MQYLQALDQRNVRIVPVVLDQCHTVRKLVSNAAEASIENKLLCGIHGCYNEKG